MQAGSQVVSSVYFRDTGALQREARDFRGCRSEIGVSEVPESHAKRNAKVRAYFFQVIEHGFGQAPASTTAAGDVDPEVRDLDDEQPDEQALKWACIQAMDHPVEEMVVVEKVFFVEVDGKLESGAD